MDNNCLFCGSSWRMQGGLLIYLGMNIMYTHSAIRAADVQFIFARY